MAELVIGLFGPTAAGKSDVAAAVAMQVPAEVVSADAMQVYEGLPILTNRSQQLERLVGIWPLSHAASVGEYAPLAQAAIDEILAAGRTPLVVGGTGLYFRAALAELALPPAPAPGARERWVRLYEDGGAKAAHARLEDVDPAAAARVHPNDRRRVVRALELAEAGGSLVPERERLFGGGWRHPTLLVGLEVPQAELERRIVARTRRMFENGVEDEVRRALGGTGLRDGAEGHRTRGGRRPAAGGGARSGARTHPALRRLPAQVDAAARRARYRRRRPVAGGGRR